MSFSHPRYARHGEARRRLGEVLVKLLDLVKVAGQVGYQSLPEIRPKFAYLQESSKAEMKAAAFGALHNLVMLNCTLKVFMENAFRLMIDGLS